MLQAQFLALVTAPLAVWAAYQVPESAFTDDNGSQAAELGQPLFFFASGSCYPESAIDSNGNQVGSEPADACTDLDAGCFNKIAWTGHDYSQGALEPQYFSISKCGDNTYRVVYNLFFKHDSGHPYDWEWAAVIWHQDGAGLWYTSNVILEQDGFHADYTWDKLDTFDDMDDLFNNGYGANKNHPKIYVSKFHHSMHTDACGSDKNSCAYLADYEFRASDFYMFNLQVPDLYPISVINPNWNFGEARNPHDTAAYICGDGLRGLGRYCTLPPPKPPGPGNPGGGRPGDDVLPQESLFAQAPLEL